MTNQHATIGEPCGLLYYQAGIAVLSASVFTGPAAGQWIEYSTRIAAGILDADCIIEIASGQINATQNFLLDRISKQLQMHLDTELLILRLITQLNLILQSISVEHITMNLTTRPTQLT